MSTPSIIDTPHLLYPDGYDFGYRLKGDPAHRLAPTYSNFFVNVDRTVDRGGYLNDHCLVLKTVTVAGLPLEESPCLDIWDSQGQVYASHSGWKADPSCAWNTDYGDGFFKISRSILGDFAIVCRFGGHLANTKDKSTLIFKYQNSTAFVGEEVIDLRSADVDINPQYLDSIDQESFVVHLMFESIPSKDSNATFASQGPKLPHYPRAGLESFEAGLDELSKLHSVVPDGKRSLELSNRGNSSERYLSLALQLANNRVEDAERLVDEMKNRAALLSGDTKISSVKALNDVNNSLSIKVNEEEDNWELVESEQEVVDGRCMICQRDSPDLIDQLISCSKCNRSHHSTCVGLRRIPFTSATEKDKESRERYVRRHYGTWLCQPCKRRQQEAEEESARLNEAALLNINAAVTSSSSSGSSGDSSKQRSNLSQPTSRLSYSVATSGGGVIVTDKAIHMTNSTGQPMPKIVPSNNSDGSSRSSSSHFNEDNKNKERSSPTRSLSSSSSSHPMSPNFRTKTDHVAVLLGLLSSASLALEDVTKMEPVAQRELLQSIVQKRYPGSSLANDSSSLLMEPMGQMDLATAMQGIIANAAASKQRRAESSSSSSSFTARTASFFGGQLMDEQQLKSAANDHLPPDLQPKEEAAFDPRKHMLSMMLKRSSNAAGGGDSNGDGNSKEGASGGYVQSDGNGNNNGGGNTGFLSSSTGGANVGGGGGRGVSTNQGGQSSTPQGLRQGTDQVQGVETAAAMNSRQFEEKANAVTLSLTSGLASTKVKDIPEYSRYFKMIKAGIDKVAVAEKAVADGVVGSRDVARRLLDLNPDEPVPFQLYEQLNVLVTVASHPKYERFFKMLKLGIGKEQIKAKMVEEGLDPSYVDKDPIEKITAHDMKKKAPVEEDSQVGRFIQLVKEGNDKAEVARQMADQGLDPSILDRTPATVTPPGLVAASDHPVYSKYFKMLRVGLGAEAIKAKMRQENLDPAILDKDPSSLLPEAGKDDSSSKDKQEMVPAAEHPQYSKYFKMLKVGLPKEAVKAKMTQEGVNNTSVLDKEPGELIPLQTESEAKAKAEAADTGPQVKVSEHPVYAKYFRMVKVGLPKEAVKAKMVQEGAKPEILDKDPDDMIPLNDENKTKAKIAVHTVPAGEHPLYSKYFKMLKVGLPKDAVKAKMKAENVDPSVLDKDPSDLIPLEGEAAEEDEGPMIRADEHPTYTKYFKMLKVGLPPDGVKAKMKAEGAADPAILDKDPSTMIPVNERKAGSAAGPNKASAAIKPKPKKKKLHWKALDASKVHASSLWADEHEESAILMDEEEFKQLFVESAASPGKDTAAGAKKAAAVAAKAAKDLKKPKVVSLVDMKRAQNGGIALARVKFSFEELREKLLNMHDEGLTADQLKNLREYLPTPEETAALRGYSGPREQLGIVERYMNVMMDFCTAHKHISIMLFKQQFRPRLLECRTKISRVQDACDDVRLSARLKRVLKAILKVGNQLNEGEENKGFSVDSLLKLQTAKALDKKTTILQYVVMLIFRNDEDALKFPEDLKHVNEAARITMEMIIGEKNSLQQEFDSNSKLLEDIRAASDDPSSTNAMLDFFVKVDASCKELEKGYEKAKEKFSGVLSYFGEDPAMASHDFFTTLSRFVQVFILLILPHC